MPPAATIAGTPHHPLVQLRRGRRTPQLEARLRAVQRGEVCFDAATRAAYGHDASNYRHPPLGVVTPRSIQDVVETVRVCREFDVPIVSRGGGTSLAGQSINEAVVLDFSRHLGRILELDPEARRVKVLPGTLLDELHEAAKVHDLTFGPDPATRDCCTIGGMLGNNSCGIHSALSEFHGPGARTSDQVEELELLTYDGARITVGRTSDAEYEQILAAGGHRAEIYAQLRDLRDRHAAAIRAEFPRLPRRVSGYNLPELLPERGFHVARSLVGSEGTCVTVLSATLTLVPALVHRVMVAVAYPNIGAAGDAIPQVREHRPIACEGFDRRLVQLLRRDPEHERALADLPPGNAWLLVEFGADNPASAEAQARHFMASIAGQPHTHAEIIRNPQIERRVWKIRESSRGPTADPPDHPETSARWEGAAVPPERVGDYLRELDALLRRAGHDVSLYGHFAQGCVHARISFDLSTTTGIAHYRRLTEKTAELVVRHGGSLSGEHGDGQSRGDLLAKMYSPTIMAAMREFKQIWDPRERMNPGRIVDARPRTEALKLADYHPRPQLTKFAFVEDHGDFAHAANRCVGVGECRRIGGGVMCPSYMVTRQERHCTRGRARLLFEMLMSDVVDEGWRSDAVFDALDLCLACKGCKRECPASVDMATYKAEFMAHYYRGKLRPRQAYAMGWIHRWAAIASATPRLANFLLRTPGLSALTKWAGNVAWQRELPRVANPSFRRWFAQRPRRQVHGGRRIVLWPDTLNDLFYPEVLIAATRVLERTGYVVTIPERRLCCGRPLYDFGMLDAARRLWHRNLSTLAPDIAAGTPIVGLEPSCVAAFRDELPNLFPDDPLAARLGIQTRTFAELLDERDDLNLGRLHTRALVHFHCHHRSVLGVAPDQRVFARLGVGLEIPEPGCCGMAGAFGFERGKLDVSLAIAERLLLPAVRRADSTTVVLSDGFSCREQIRQATGRRPLHLAELMARSLTPRTIESATGC